MLRVFKHFLKMNNNINYKGMVSSEDMKKFSFPPFLEPPRQKIIKLSNLTLLIFPSGKCRLMGLCKPLTDISSLPVKVTDLKIQSITVVFDLGYELNLLRLSRQLSPRTCMFEPELFPALRLTHFNPLCVNVFASGKIVVLGLKQLSYHNILKDIRQVLEVYKR